MSSSDYRSPEENETFYQEGLARLRAGQMEESTGKLIMDLMEIRTENLLVPYARKWIKLFPNVESAPRLTGKWLQNYGSNDAMYLATAYVKTYPDVKALILIVRAAANMHQLPRRLFTAIERRFSAEPNSHVWAALQAHGNQNPELDQLLVRWIQINRANPDVDIDMSTVALLTASKDVLEESLRWAEFNQTRAKHIRMVLGHLFRGQSEAHRLIAGRVAELSRAWLARNSDSEECGKLHSDLVSYMQSEVDIQNAKDWYRKHSTAKDAVHALTGILSGMHGRGEKPDPYIVSQAKAKLRGEAPEERVPVLAGALARACPDKESIALAKETVMCNPLLTWLHAELLQVAPDSELIAKANDILSSGSQAAPDLIIAMLKIDNSNTVAVKAAERWMRCYRDNEQVKTIESLLPAGEKRKPVGVQSKRKA